MNSLIHFVRMRAMEISCAIAALLVISASAIAASAFFAVSAGEIDFEGGVETVSFSGGAFSGGGGTETQITGTCSNELPAGVKIKDLTIQILRKGSGSGVPGFDSATANGVTNGNEGNTLAGDGEEVKIDFPEVGGNEEFNFVINGVNAGGVNDMELRLTHSVPDVKDDSFEANTMHSFTFGFDTTIAGNRSPIFYDRFCAPVQNRDEDYDVVQLEGTLTLPSGTSETVSAVYLLDAQNFQGVSGASVSIDGNSFTINGIDPLTSDDLYYLDVVLTGALNGHMALLTLEAILEP